MRFLLLLLAGLLICTAPLRAQGIVFHQGDLKSLFAKAAAEHKPVYVDVYTTWCGPCKLMAKNIFPDSAVGAFMNARFISCKVDAERGEGIAFAAKNKVAAYPTSLYFSPAGEMVFQHVGYEADKKKYIATGQTALDEIASPENLLAMRRKLAAGERDTASLYRYLTKLRAFGMSGYEARDVAVATLKALPAEARKSPRAMLPLCLANRDGDLGIYEACLPVTDGMKAIAGNSYDDLQNAFLSANEKQLPAATAAGTAALRKRLGERRRIMAGAPGRDEASMAQDEAYMRLRLAQDHHHPEALNPEVPAFVKRYWLSATDSSLKASNDASVKFIREQLAAYFAENATPEEEQKAMLAQYAGPNQARDGLASNLNTFAWAYYKMKRPQPEIQMALGWIDFALKMRPGYTNGMDTKAHLQESLGQREAAIATENKAISLAEASGENADSYQDYLAELVAVNPALPKPKAAHK